MSYKCYHFLPVTAGDGPLYDITSALVLKRTLDPSIMEISVTCSSGTEKCTITLRVVGKLL